MTGEESAESAAGAGTDRPLVRSLRLGLDAPRIGPLQAALALASAPLGWLNAHRAGFLHGDEEALLTDRLHPRRRHGLLIGRYAAKCALAALRPDLDPRTLAIRPGVLEQPVLSGEGTANLGVSLSHAGPVAVAVVFPEACPMGIDLERIRPANIALLTRQTTAVERRNLAACLAVPEAERLTRLWCLKEALSKALRCGLTVPLDLLAVGRVEAGPTGLGVTFAHFAQYRGLSLAAGDLAAALVLPRPPAVTLAIDAAEWAAFREALAEAAAREMR
ncbi:4'-phosphopantetheinyl transferase [Methylorubrum populi]|uniref:4'-phosphopantetheinyl transferase n=1 Tax=Methylorubrum populi TaxID=223967 RepID=A0A160PCK4_9HYPH|nr:4'-phosphopantetheinyl transferase superfamily protein [Methylorubrum populi]BAU90124.1 4'-phosphopantetheinyl transferase [Methylorubrum populi]